MQVGQKIWAIDPCEIPSGKKYLTVGKPYEIKEVTLTDVCVCADTNEDLFFFKDKFDKFFSLTPPKEVKEGDFKKCGEGGNTCSCNNASECGYLNKGDYWKESCLLAEKCLEESPCDPDMTTAQIEAWNDYRDYLEMNGKL